jgi:hypothetical protein
VAHIFPIMSYGGGKVTPVFIDVESLLTNDLCVLFSVSSFQFSVFKRADAWFCAHCSFLTAASTRANSLVRTQPFLLSNIHTNNNDNNDNTKHASADQLNSFTHLRALLVLHDHGILGPV